MSEPLRIAFISHAYPELQGNHAGQFVHELASTLVQLGHEVHAIIPKPSQKGYDDEMDGVRLHFFESFDKISYGYANDQYIKTPKLSVALSLISATYKLHKIVKQHNIELIHAHWAIPMGFVASLVKAVTRVPLIITTHGRDVYVDPEAGAIVPTLWYVRPFLKYALQHADRIIAVSKDCSQHAIRAGAPPNKTMVVYNGVNAEHFSPQKGSGKSLRDDLGLSKDAKLILFVGSLVEYKGVDTLIHAMSDVIQKEKNARLLIIGQGEQQDELSVLCEGKNLTDYVFFMGAIPNEELPYYENGCDLFVLPSRRESFGIAAIEAMACAKPVIGTKVGGLKEVIHDNKTGYLIEPNDPNELATAILNLLGNEYLAAEFGQAGKDRVERFFAWSNISEKIVEMYRGLLDD